MPYLHPLDVARGCESAPLRHGAQAAPSDGRAGRRVCSHLNEAPGEAPQLALALGTDGRHAPPVPLIVRLTQATSQARPPKALDDDTTVMGRDGLSGWLTVAL